jgi:hypothetical protein
MEHLDFLNPDEAPENECGFCGNACEDEFCSKDCLIANEED